LTYRTYLKNSKVPDPKALVLYAADFDLSELVLKLDEEIPEEMFRKLEEVSQKVLSGLPLQYALRKAPFYGFWFQVDERVLIPRFDSEILVNEVLKAIPEEETVSVLDLCTGSGCIGLCIKALRPESSAVLTDVSEDALSVAKENAARLSVQAEFIKSDLFSAVDGVFDVIVSNPPYIRTEEIGTLDDEVKDHEPRLALDGGADGLKFYRRIAREAGKHLKNGGKIFLEIGYDEGASVSELLENAGFGGFRTVKDLAGKDRGVAACWNNWNN
jgi:release factor glutamine methyltransferase